MEVTETLDPLVDPGLPDRLRHMAGELEELARHTRALVDGLMPPPSRSPLGAAHAYATELQERSAVFLAWVDSATFPAVAAGQRDRFRTAAGRLLTSARRLSAATERRRVDELIERAGEAMQQAGALFARANAAVMRDLQAQVEAIGRGGR
jgi:hypothetical protein